MSVPVVGTFSDESRSNKRLGTQDGVGTSHTSVGQVASGKVFNINTLHLHNILSGSIVVSVWIATSSWSSGAPAGGTLVSKIVDALPIDPKDIVSLGGYILANQEKLIVVSDTAASLTVYAGGEEMPA